MNFALVNVRDVHLGRAQNGSMTPGNDRGSIITFAIVALLILGMACVNFVNLATARASQRAREVALRKVLGANRRQLVLQFIGESILVSAVAMLVALALTELLLPLGYKPSVLDRRLVVDAQEDVGRPLRLGQRVLVEGAGQHAQIVAADARHIDREVERSVGAGLEPLDRIGARDVEAVDILGRTLGAADAQAGAAPGRLFRLVILGPGNCDGRGARKSRAENVRS